MTAVCTVKIVHWVTYYASGLQSCLYFLNRTGCVKTPKKNDCPANPSKSWKRLSNSPFFPFVLIMNSPSLWPGSSVIVPISDKSLTVGKDNIFLIKWASGRSMQQLLTFFKWLDSFAASLRRKPLGMIRIWRNILHLFQIYWTHNHFSTFRWEPLNFPAFWQWRGERQQLLRRCDQGNVWCLVLL